MLLRPGNLTQPFRLRLSTCREAKQEFWRQIKDCCNKVASSIDITNLDVHSLSLSLEPLKGWLDTFQSLSPPKKQALMEEKNLPDLQAGLFSSKGASYKCLGT